jgi:predicted RNA-binding Zn ribbon-like protein
MADLDVPGDTPTAWVLPGEPTPVRLMNTIWADRRGAHDSLSTPAELDSWLAAVGPVEQSTRATAADLDRARRLRGALRRLAALVAADPRAEATRASVEAAVEAVNSAAAAAPDPPRLALSGGRLRRNPRPGGPPIATAVSAIAAEAIELLTSPAARPLRACLAPGCVLYFVGDHPRREWCSTACGNRARAARHYRRHHPASG